MAGGIDWFRWHHGSVSDPKFQLVAKKAAASVAEVIAVWACILEAASQSEQRGTTGEHDFEAMDCALGLSDGKSREIHDRMRERDLIDAEGTVTAWNKRQPKREREDDLSTDRVQAFRERKRHETPRNASESTETPRGEERREENSSSLRSEVSAAAPSGTSPPPPSDFNGRNAEALNGKAIVLIAVDWELPEQWGIDAEALGWKPGQVLHQAEKFRQYWSVGKGAGKRRSVKGWRQAWSNWLEKAAKDHR